MVWRVEGGRLHLTWDERGGPPVDPPTRRGFGSRLIERGLRHELGGNVALDFAPKGLQLRHGRAASRRPGLSGLP